MESIVSLSFEGPIATLVMDDSSMNVISPRMIRELNKALDEVEQKQAILILKGREGVFSAGFDLKVMRKGVMDAFNMIIGGFKLAARLLAFPRPVIIACNGHAVAMGSFLLLSGDYRIGSSESYKIVANEVQIGLTLPYSAIAICRQRLAPAHFVRATLLSEEYNHETAVEAGWLDKVVAADDLLKAAHEAAAHLTKLDMKAHRESKLRARRRLLRKLKRALIADRLYFVFAGIRRMFG